MNVRGLNPYPNDRQNFRRDRQKFLPTSAGCYVLTSTQGIVLYMGLTINLRRRFGEHLDDPRKTCKTANGRAVFFYWLTCDELERIERTWQIECETADGVLPILNRVASPIST